MKSLYADFKYLDKKETQSKDIFVFYLIKPFFHLNILLWYINFFGTSEQSIQNINHNKILVNNKTIKSNFILKKGDVISLNTNKVIEKKTSFKLIRKKYRPNPTFLTFLEVDHYAKKIVIIKGLDDLSFNDFNLLVNEYVKLNSFNK